MLSCLLLPTNEVCEGYVLTGVCLSTGVWGGMHGVCVVGACMAGGVLGRGSIHVAGQAS